MLPRQITPELLDALRWVESAGGKRLLSPKGARGPYQLMPSTAKMYGVDPMDEAQSRWAAQAILEDNLERFGDVDKALMGYHAGSGNMNKWLAGKPSGVGPLTLSYPSKVKTALGFPQQQPQPVQVASLDKAAGFKNSYSPSEETIPAPDAVGQFRNTAPAALAALAPEVAAVAPGTVASTMSAATPRNGGKMNSPWAWMTGGGGASAGSAAADDDRGMLGLLSNRDKLMAMFAGIQRAGGEMSKPGGNWGTGLAAFGPGMSEGIQQGVQYGLLSDKLKEKAEKKRALAGFKAKYPHLADVADLSPELALKRAHPEPAAPTELERLTAWRDKFQPNTPNWKLADAAIKKQTERDWENPGYVAAQSQIAAARRQPPPSTELSRLMSERDSLPPDDQRRASYDDAIKKATTSSPLVSVDQTGEREENKRFGAQLVDEYKAIAERANASADAINQLSIARTIKAPAGALAPLQAKIGALAQGLGFSPETLKPFGLDKATDAQAFTGVMQNLVLTKMQAQKGPQTENDAKRIESTVAGLSNTEEAQDFLMRAAMSLAKRDVEQREFFDAYRAQKKTLDGAAAAWRKEVQSRPLVGMNPTTKLPVFFDEFVEGVRKANPGATAEQILDLWTSKYGN